MQLRTILGKVGQRTLVSYFGLVAWPVPETKSDKSRLGEAAAGRTPDATYRFPRTNPFALNNLETR